jgi:hypothetical protein
MLCIYMYLPIMYFSFFFSSLVLNDLCLHVEQLKKRTKKMVGVLPEYSCLVLSPANLWQQDINMFQKDSQLISTIFNHHVSMIFNF